MKKTTKIIIGLLMFSYIAWVVMFLCWPAKPLEIIHSEQVTIEINEDLQDDLEIEDLEIDEEF